MGVAALESLTGVASLELRPLVGVDALETLLVGAAAIGVDVSSLLVLNAVVGLRASLTVRVDAEAFAEKSLVDVLV